MIDIAHISTAFIAALSHVPTTLLMSAIALVIGLLLGLGIALIRFYEVKFLSNALRFIITILRSIPIVLILLASYLFSSILLTSLNQQYALWPNLQNVNANYIALFAFIIFTTVQASEMFRGALNAIDKGQFDAAKSIGQSTRQMLVRIILPQLLPISVPMIGNLSISLIKATSLVSLISVVDILSGALITANTNYRFLESYLAAAFIYWMIAILIEQVTNLFERRQNNVLEGEIV